MSLGGRPQAGFPLKSRTTLRYNETVGVNPGAGGVLASYQWRANDIFDPNLTGAGHQPLGRDIFAQLYSHYTVHRSRLHLTAFPMDAGMNTPLFIGCYLTDPGQAIAGNIAETLIEQGNTAFDMTSSLMTANTAKIVKLDCNFDAKKWFGVQDVQDNINIGSEFNAHPSDVVAFTVFIQDALRAADVGNVILNVNIEYDVEFTDPIEQLTN